MSQRQTHLRPQVHRPVRVESPVVLSVGIVRILIVLKAVGGAVVVHVQTRQECGTVGPKAQERLFVVWEQVGVLVVVVQKVAVLVVSRPGSVAPGLEDPHPLGYGVEVIVVIHQFIQTTGRVIVENLAAPPGQPGAGGISVIDGKYFGEQAQWIEIVRHLGVRRLGLVHGPVPVVDPRIGVLPVAPADGHLALQGEPFPLAQIPVDPEHLRGRGQAVIDLHHGSVAIVPYIPLGPAGREEDRLSSAALAVVLPVGGDFYMVVVGYRQLHAHLAQVRSLYQFVVQTAQIVGQQNRFRTVRRPGAAPGAAPLHRRQEADLSTPQFLAAGVDQHDVVVDQQRSSQSIGGRVVAQPHPQRLQRLILVGRQAAAERTARSELFLGIPVVGIHIGQAEGRRRSKLDLGVSSHQIGEVRTRRGAQGTLSILFVGLAGPREQQGSLIPVRGIIQTHAAEPGFVEGEGREHGVEPVAHHQPIVAVPIPVRRDDQVLKKPAVFPGLPDGTALGIFLHLIPFVEQPAAVERPAEQIVPLLAL